MSEQLLLFDIKEEKEVCAAFYMSFWDKEGLPITGLVDNWYPFLIDSKPQRDKAFSDIKRRFDGLTSTGLTGFAEIRATDTNLPTYQCGDESLTLKHYPETQMKGFSNANRSDPKQR